LRNDRKKAYGEFLTPPYIFEDYILPEIENEINKYRWVDMFCGEGNLVLPILELVPKEKRVEFFEKHIFLFDVQKRMVERAVEKAVGYGIPEGIARRNIVQRDTIKNYPRYILDGDLPVYHITNPPHLAVDYIVKHEETRKYLGYFRGQNKGYRNLYQLALMNDLRNGVGKMIYIIPSNFMFAPFGSRKIRDDFLPYYSIKKAYILEDMIREFRGNPVSIFFFERKDSPKKERIIFEGTKIFDEGIKKKIYILDPKYHFKAEPEFDEFIEQYRAPKPLKFLFLTWDEVKRNEGNNKIVVVDSDVFNAKTKDYEKRVIYVNDNLYQRIKSNILSVRLADRDSVSGEERIGIYVIEEKWKADGAVVSKSNIKGTHPVQILFSSSLSRDGQILFKNYFNLVLGYFREKYDSDFMASKRRSTCRHVKRAMGFLQMKGLLETFPILSLEGSEREELRKLIEKKDAESVISFIKHHNRKVISLGH
jgi:hypothetical protein